MRFAPLAHHAAELQGRHAISAWKDWMARLYGLQSDVYGDQYFAARLATLSLGSLGLTRLEAGRHRVQRTASGVHQQPRDLLKIVAPWQGEAIVCQQGPSTTVTPGHWTIYDTTQEYEVLNPHNSEHLIITLPKSHFAHHGPALSTLMGRYCGGAQGVSHMALALMRNCYQQAAHLPATMAPQLAGNLLQLIELALWEAAGSTAPRPQQVLRQRILRYVRQHLRHSRLDASHLAHTLGCSKRQIYLAFEGEAMSLTQTIWHERVALLQRELAHPQQQHCPFNELALACGFASAAHASRLFKQHTGISPTQYRAQLAQAQSWTQTPPQRYTNT